MASSVAIAFANQYQREIAYAYNRKEAKDHGEGGLIVGAELKGRRVLIIDDVITAGTAFREAKDIIENNGGTVAGIAVALDRQERGQGRISAIDEIKQQYNIPVINIASLQDIIAYCVTDPKLKHWLNSIQTYQANVSQRGLTLHSGARHHL